MMQQRNDFLDFTKGSLITLVVFGHVLQLAVYQNVAFWSDPLFKAIYMFHMPLLIAVSGYLAHRAIASTPTMDLVRRRSVAYLLPVIVWATLFQLALSAGPGHKPLGELPSAIFFEITGVHLWFLWASLGCLALTVLASWAGRYSAVSSVVVFLMLLAVPETGNLYLLKYTFPFFLLGYHAARLESLPGKIGLRALTVLSGAGACACFYLWHEETYIYVTRMGLSSDNLPNIALRYLAGSVVSAFALCVLFHAFRWSNQRLRGWLIAAGKDSIYIYVISSYLSLVMLEVSRRYFNPTTRQGVAALVAVSLGSAMTAICWYLGKVLSSNAVLAKLLFGKSRTSPTDSPQRDQLQRS